ncbi:FecR domain-containing protein [Oceanibacterium hippocampi]|uniref:FecR protein n=1 Tax=Oceanibacterium hippocampi TaxID=745714 RepID=A0A1Y5S053_9PROT|nr:FecR domain-containing protein [Oceanibacterium hippocampi]SLN29437.1 FecR protein [Oceanibacterium hippocampi]
MKLNPLPLAVCTALLCTLAVPAHANRVGVAAAVNPQATGTPPTLETRILVPRDDMTQNERVQTQENGRTQLLFLDGSALTVGPNSDIVLDEFVYDPDAGSGRIVLSATKGLFRLVGGKISKKTPMLIKTPSATIGIRGGIMVVRVREDGTITSKFFFGEEMFVESGGTRQVAVRPNSTIDVTELGGIPQEPQVVPDDMQLRLSLDELEADRNRDGEEPAPLVEVALAGSGMPAQGSELPPEDLAGNAPPAEDKAANGDDGSATAPPPDPAQSAQPQEGQQQIATGSVSGGISVPGPFSGRVRTDRSVDFSNPPADPTGDDQPFQNAFVKNGFLIGELDGELANGPERLPFKAGEFPIDSFDAAADGGLISGKGFVSADFDFFVYALIDQDIEQDHIAVVGGVPTPTAKFPTSGTTYYEARQDFLTGSNVLFLNDQNGGALITNPPETRGFIDWKIAGNNGQRALGLSTFFISGQGAGQTSALSGIVGEVLADGSGRPHIAGRQKASARLNSTGDPIFTFGSVSSADDALGNDFFGKNGPSLFALDSAEVSVTDVELGRGIDTLVSNQFPDPPYDPFTVVQKTTGPALGPTTNASLSGFSAGFFESIDPSGNPFQRLAFLSSDQTATVPDPTNFTIDVGAAENRVEVHINASDGFVIGSAGSVSVNLVLGDTVGASPGAPGGNSAILDDRTFQALDDPTSPQAVNGSGIIDAGLRTVDAGRDAGNFRNVLPGGVALCSCEYLRWGYWSGALSESSNTLHGVHLANWVAGKLATNAQIQGLAGGVATIYGGHVSATIRNGAPGNQNVYTAVGSMNMNYTFGGTQAGTWTIGNLDGASYSGAVSSIGGSRQVFRGTGTGAGRSVTVQGAFFQGGGVPNAAAGGTAHIAGANYEGAGAFAMQKN